MKAKLKVYYINKMYSIGYLKTTCSKIQKFNISKNWKDKT